jgi:hypothetical protein
MTVVVVFNLNQNMKFRRDFKLPYQNIFETCPVTKLLYANLSFSLETLMS